MWTFDDASRLDMDSRRGCPSYGVGFDLCDPLGSVLEASGRAPARIQRRRCRSEGVERSPYEDASRERRSADGRDRTRAPFKSHFTLNAGDRFHHECSLPRAHNGDSLMASEKRSYQPGKSKFYRKSPTRPLLVSTLSNTKVDDNRLPKVEELLEKLDHDMTEVKTKQPLKSILNNPMPKSPPPGILKKPKSKSYQESKGIAEGRRRQRASSESDNLYCYPAGSPVVGHDARAGYLSGGKRAKESAGGVSYGSAVASLAPRSPPRRARPAPAAPAAPAAAVSPHLQSRAESGGGACPAVSAALPAGAAARAPPPPPPAPPATPPAAPPAPPAPPPPVAARKHSPHKRKPKPKPRKMKAGIKLEAVLGEEADDAQRSRSPSPDPWLMETDALIGEIRRLERAPAAPPAPPPAAPPAPPPAAPPAAPPAPPPAAPPAPPPAAPPAPPPAAPPAAPPAGEDPALAKLSSKMNGAAVSALTKPNKDQSFLAALHTTNPFRALPTRKEPATATVAAAAAEGWLRASLFPRVPPYLRFAGHEEPALRPPAPVQKHLKWKLTSITPLVVQRTLTNSGFRLVRSDCDTAECPQEETVDWIGIWGKHMKSLMFRAIKDGQKMNHFPGTFQIGRKDRLWRNLQKLAAKFGAAEFGIMPRTYVLPHDMKLLKHDWQKHAANDERWIIKPPASARGTGIKVVSRWTQIPKKRPVVVQRYIGKPLLINGSKFDMRLYVLLTSVHPLRIYLYRDGLARFASVKYTDELSSLGDRYMHLTNYSINRLSKNYTPNEDFNSCEGHKWTLQALFQHLRAERGVDTEALWRALTDLIIKTIISGEAAISSLTKANVSSRYNCYELFGVDVLLDERLKPWLLEVNISPSLHSASPLDKHVKGPLVSAVLNVAQFQVPLKTNLDQLARDKPARLAGLPYDSRLYTMYLSKEERDKHIIYTNMDDRDMYLRDILSTLTPDDVRHLLQAEDELAAARGLARVFPTPRTHRYLPYLAGPRYYNRLFDAWEARYGDDRQAGIELLRSLCDIGYHLEVPPVPLKNDVDAPSPPASERGSAPSLASSEGAAPPAPPAPPPPAGDAP